MRSISQRRIVRPHPAAGPRDLESLVISLELMTFARQATAFFATMATALLIGQIL